VVLPQFVDLVVGDYILCLCLSHAGLNDGPRLVTHCHRTVLTSSDKAMPCD